MGRFKSIAYTWGVEIKKWVANEMSFTGFLFIFFFLQCHWFDCCALLATLALILCLKFFYILQKLQITCSYLCLQNELIRQSHVMEWDHCNRTNTQNDMSLIETWNWMVQTNLKTKAHIYATLHKTLVFFGWRSDLRCWVTSTTILLSSSIFSNIPELILPKLTVNYFGVSVLKKD